ncbi:discoidin domain-containing protein [Streptomyces sp. NPDC059568]|uniref:discoidin domain-containing protein n=1 Tax=Streptomyces sp. NPDC059568 TaxID=3346868 RepID=UPI00368C85BB
MRCPECGHVNAPGTAFCASCETFLEWGDREPSGSGTGATSGSGAGSGSGADSGGTSSPERRAPVPTPTPPAPPAPPAPTAVPRATDTETPAQEPAPAEPPPSPSSPPTTPSPPPPATGPRRPGDRLDTPVPGPGEEPAEPAHRPPPVSRGASVRCPNCRTENAPERVLCLRCGLLLDPGPPPDVPPPWWRRILARRRRALPTAGTRPKRRLWRRPSLAVPFTLVILAAAVWFARPYVPDAFDFARDRTVTPEELHPSQVRASSAQRGHPAQAAFDTYSNKFWAPAEAGPGQGEYLEADFEQPVRILKLVVFSGRSAQEDAFLSQSRPAALALTLHAADGTLTERRITLRDQPGQQTFDVRSSDVVRIRLAIDGVHGDRQGRRPAVAEIDFFGRR